MGIQSERCTRQNSSSRRREDSIQHVRPLEGGMHSPLSDDLEHTKLVRARLWS